MSRRSVMRHVLAGQRAQIARLVQGGYQVVFRRGAYLVLHRPLDQLVHQQRRDGSR
ncbi:MAG TPA: hypothetical protein VGJ19_17690 [Streptosporangiaceae bacterium]